MIIKVSLGGAHIKMSHLLTVFSRVTDSQPWWPKHDSTVMLTVNNDDICGPYSASKVSKCLPELTQLTLLSVRTHAYMFCQDRWVTLWEVRNKTFLIVKAKVSAQLTPLQIQSSLEHVITSLYVAAFLFPSTLIGLPVLAARKHLHSMMLPPPWAAPVRKWWGTPGLLQTWRLSFRPKSSICVSSDFCFSWSESPSGDKLQAPVMCCSD